jgi:prophage regulatory protein
MTVDSAVPRQGQNGSDRRTEGKAPIRLLRLKEVLKRIPVSKSTWWAGVKEGKYPKPVKIGARMRAWLESDIEELIERLRLESQECETAPECSKTRQPNTASTATSPLKGSTAANPDSHEVAASSPLLSGVPL